MSKNLKRIFMYIICLIMLFLFIIVTKTIFTRRETKIKESVILKLKSYEVKEIGGKIKIPYFDYELLDKEITDFLNEHNNKNILVDYSVNFTENLLNIFLTIKHQNNYYYKSIFYDLDKLKFIDANKVIDLKVTSDVILNKIKNKYCKKIYEKIKEDNFENSFVLLTENKIRIYFDNSLFDSISYQVYIDIKSSSIEEVSDIIYDKVVAFTFDDGPSNLTLDFVNTLIENDSKATFFELGNRMKYNQDITRGLYNLGMEVASHTYSHKNLTSLSKKEMESELNSTDIIFKEITKDAISLVRPPYGSYNKQLSCTIKHPIILWNVDTNDWLHKDEEKIYNHIIENISDGDIVLMHDLYPTTLEALKMVLPVLRQMGYKITTVSDLANEKGYTLENGIIYRFFK